MVSVIIPCYNAENYIQESVNSILNQTYENIEVIVIDDASTDNSYNRLSKIRDRRLKLLKNTQNLGYLRTINLLLEQVSGKFIAFQDADDVSHSRRLEIQRNFLSSNAQVSIVGTNYCVIDSRGNVIRTCQVDDEPAKIKTELKQKNKFQKPSIMFKKEVINKIGGFREAFLELGNISEDYDWLLRANRFFKLSNINFEEPLYYYRSLSTAMTKGFNHPAQLIGHEIAQLLDSQRDSEGIDQIDKNEIEELKRLIDEKVKIYLKYPDRFYTKKAEMLMYSGLKIEALTQGLRAVQCAPTTLRNYKLIQYILRKIIFSN